MKTLKKLRITFVAAALALTGAAQAQEVLKLGMSVSMSGAGAVWGLGMQWLGQEAAKSINDAGGVKVGGKTYRFEIVAYDNKYNAAEGTKVAQTLLNRDNVRYVVAAIGTAPVMALQSLSERKGVLLFNVAWGPSIKGPNFPLTFTTMNTPGELIPPLYAYIKQDHPAIRTVAILNPNDATGKETEMVARKAWESLGVKVVASDWYERGTTDFQPIAAKVAGLKPDVVDLGTAPPSDSAQAFKELGVLGWRGVKLVAAGTSPDAMIKIGGDAVDGVYLGASADFEGPQSTDLQRRLSKGLRTAVGEPMNVVQVAAYDAVLALKAGMEAANSVEPRAIAAALPKILLDTTYGKTGFGGKETYGSPQQLLLPVVITQIKGGKLVELKRVPAAELTKRLAEKK